MIKNKHIFIFGGTGSIGIELIKKYIRDNTIINYSRDEKKHWELDSMFRSNASNQIFNGTMVLLNMNLVFKH